MNDSQIPQKQKKMNLKPLILSLILMAAVLGIYFYMNAQKDVAEALAEKPITVEELIDQGYLEDVVQTLASPEYEGRLPGTAGNEKAVSFIQSEMIAIGLENPAFTEAFLMPFEMLLPIKQSVTEISLASGTETIHFNYGTDFTEISFRDFAKAKGNLSGGFKLISDNSNLYDFDAMGNPEIVVYEKSAIDGLNLEVFFNGIISQENAPKVVLYEFEYKNGDHFILSPYSRMMTGYEEANAILIYKVSETLIDVLDKSPEGTLSVKSDVLIDTVKVPNVIGMIDGTGDEGYIISAHFDHLGDNFNGTYNAGALDNASGTATMLALAKAIKTTADPALDYYFIAFNGEEEGLYGSAFFVNELPLDPDKFRVVNIDMVGSSSSVSMEIAATNGKSILFQDEAYKLANELSINAIKSDKGSSDHVPLSDVGFVAISLTEFDQRYYHTPNDTVENSMDFEDLDAVGEFVYKLLFPKEDSTSETP